ncbi:MAG: hypothetical protein Q8O28_14210 [Smithellaceae bacterium]|nr:hypothetical protein [Smithellaceae bacterium]
MLKYKIYLPLVVVFLAIFAWVALGAQKITPQAKQPHQESLRWVSLSTDSRDTVREIIRSEVDNRESFSTRQEEKTNLKLVEDEKEREDSDYKNAIVTANKEFVRAKKRRDDVTSQFQMASTDLDESAKGIKTIRTTIENLDGQINRYEQDTKAQQESLKRWLQTEKQGEILVAVIYTRGFRDSAHTLEGSADVASAPLIATHMGTYIQAFTKVINHVTAVDFIRATEEGTAKWNNEEPIRIELDKTVQGTTYLRLKRYELYPFQENKSGKVKPATGAGYKAAIVQSRKDLEAFLAANKFSPGNYELDKANKVIANTIQSNTAAEEGLNEQVKTFQDRILNLQGKISTAKAERETQKNLLKRREESYYKFSLDVAAIREKKDLSERSFQQAQAVLHEKKRVHESIIIKSALAATKGSQTPAEASAEVILDKLVEVKNDAKTQHSSSATEVTNFQVTSEAASQSITEARITAIRLISFVNEGESVRVKMAFRVRTILEEQTPAEEPAKPRVQPLKKTDQEQPVSPMPESEPTPKDKPSYWDKIRGKVIPPEPENKPASNVQPPVLAKRIPPFKRTYRPLAVKDALGCLFELRSVNASKDGLRVLVEVINTDKEPRKVAFYDDKFGSWPRSNVFSETGNAYPTTQAYVWQGAQKKTMAEIDSRGRGVEIQPQTSVTMELIFKNIPANVKTVKINLHPFIYYGSRETWQEFDLKMPEMRLQR